MFENIADRLFSNWKTSLFALALAGFSWYLLHANKIDWPAWSVMMSSAVTILFLRDKKSVDKRDA